MCSLCVCVCRIAVRFVAAINSNWITFLLFIFHLRYMQWNVHKTRPNHGMCTQFASNIIQLQRYGQLFSSHILYAYKNERGEIFRVCPTQSHPNIEPKACSIAFTISNPFGGKINARTHARIKSSARHTSFALWLFFHLNWIVRASASVIRNHS